MKRIFACTILAGVLALSLAACSKKDDSTPSAPADSTPATSEVTSLPEETSAPEEETSAPEEEDTSAPEEGENSEPALEEEPAA